MKIYTFEFNPCIFESCFETISLHFEKKDAYKAMREKKLADYQEWLDQLTICKKRRGQKIPDWIFYRIVKRIVR